MNVLQIVQTNTSTLDTTLPALWYLRRQHPTAALSILYCVGNRRQVLRDSRFVDEFCRQNRIAQLDLADFLRVPEIVKSAWRLLHRNSPNDAFPVRELLAKPWLLLSAASAHAGMGLRRRLESRIGGRLIGPEEFDDRLRPDVVLFDLRQKSRFYGREALFDFFYRKRPSTFLLPHSPHDITADSELAAFDEQGEEFPDFCKYWIPFAHSRAHERFPDRPGDFPVLGYPAFDTEWLAHLRPSARPSNARPKCLLLTRNFYGKGEPAPDGEWFTVPYAAVTAFLNRVADADEKLGNRLDFVVKPHPKASMTRTLELLRETRLTNWTVSYESFYGQIPTLDLVISSFTTSLLITQMAGVPTILLEDELQRYVHRWEPLERLYGNLSLYCRPEAQLADLVDHALTDYSPERDIAHLREDFPDRNLAAIDRYLTARVEHAV